MTDPSYYIPLAQAAEAAGYHAMTIPDSIAYPFESDAKIPYTPDGNRESSWTARPSSDLRHHGGPRRGDHPLHFNFFVLKLPIRPPALVAKQAGSGGPDRKPGRAGRQDQPWPGLRDHGRALRQARQADGRVH